MRAQLAGGLLLFALIAPAGAESNNVLLNVAPESKLWVEGTSTVRSFRCTAGAFDATVDAATTDAATAVLAGTKAVRSVEVKVPVAKLDCGNGTMNEHLRKALKAPQAPTIVFTLSSYELASQGATSKVRMNGTLSMGGSERPIQLSADAAPTPNSGGELEVTGLTAAQIGDAANEAGIALHELTPQQASLEEAFMTLTREEVEYKSSVPAGDDAEVAA